ncbi:HlyD family efflux transporter periplasmic adaptor subunit [Psychrilyobacter piezotolerans]|uniref:HlyD family efflux transporter periplasmic adaptor subunit n=2 Tax=Fusobacteriaceae TaxID=203492 RepID=A0ABX9KKJ4_9FUSO|nr:efflux RND transporter periplasmic adaptor subunit [Psychrilyobacter sp. S5]REI43072.1 HlyD family efflux transporter periplasmic adaptor subunit [Psychrilyobacter piezotolerans]
MNMKKKIIIAVTALLIIGGGFTVLKNKNNKDTASVRLVKISNENISENLKFEGIVNARKTYGLYKKVPMIIEEVNINPGTMVKKGDELIVFSGVGSNGFENTGVSSIFIELEEKKLEVEVLEKQLTELERKEKVVKFQLDNANSTAEIMKELLEQDGVSSLEANKYITDAALKDLEYNNVIKDISLAEQRLKIKSDGLDEEMKEMSRNLAAPENGIITEVFVENGMMAVPGKPLLSFASLDGGLEVKVLIPVYQSQGVATGAGVDIISKGSLEEKRYRGKVISISSVAVVMKNGNNEERYLTATVELDDTKGLLPGANVGVEISGKALSGINVVDAFSVIEENGKNYVYIIENNRARRVEIQTGIKTLSKYEVLNLPEGMEVVVNPFKVRDGEKVLVKSNQ